MEQRTWRADVPKQKATPVRLSCIFERDPTRFANGYGHASDRPAKRKAHNAIPNATAKVQTFAFQQWIEFCFCGKRDGFVEVEFGYHQSIAAERTDILRVKAQPILVVKISQHAFR